MVKLQANARNARWSRGRSANVEIGRIFSWLPVLLAVSFPLAAVAVLLSGRQGAEASRASAADPTPPPTVTFSFAIPEAFTDEVKYWAPDILRWSVEYELPAELIATVMQIESCGNPSVRSNAGASGLFQVMPYHFGAGENPLEPETNAFRGLSYLARSLELAAGDAALALAGYNGGHGQITRAPRLWPAETQRYVHWGTEILSDIKRGTLPSQGIASWLQAGGASLCHGAAVTQASG